MLRLRNPFTSDTGPTQAEIDAEARRLVAEQRAEDEAAQIAGRKQILTAIIRQGYSWPGEDH